MSSSLRALKPAATWRVPFPRWRWCLASSMRWPTPVLPKPAGSLMHGGWWRPSVWGADAIVMDTRFLATPEANAHPAYKAKLLAATEEQTVRTILFGHGWPGAPHRTLRTRFVEQWLGRENETQGSRADEPIVGQTTIAGQAMPYSALWAFRQINTPRATSSRWICWPANRWVWWRRFNPQASSCGESRVELRS